MVWEWLPEISKLNEPDSSHMYCAVHGGSTTGGSSGGRGGVPLSMVKLAVMDSSMMWQVLISAAVCSGWLSVVGHGSPESMEWITCVYTVSSKQVTMWRVSHSRLRSNSNSRMAVTALLYA